MSHTEETAATLRARADDLLCRRLPAEALSLYRGALELEPRDTTTRLNLALALRHLALYAEAATLLDGLLTERPGDAFVHNQLGKVRVLSRDFAAALPCFETAAALDPQDADSRAWIGAVRHSLGDLAAAEADYARAAALRPLTKRPAARQPPAFTVLALCAPVAANTPILYLTEDVSFDVNIYLVFADAEPDLALLRSSGDVLLNLVSDADQAGPLLGVAADLAAAIGLPLLNDPRRIAATTRDAMAARLGSIPDCRLPRTLRLAAGVAADPATLSALLARHGLGFPLLARPAGTHGGDDFESFDAVEPLAAFLTRHSASDRYLIEYVDYASADGYFRKYRFVFVGQAVMPYHLAIGEGWKVHHATTPMAERAWMREEERAFLEHPETIVGPAIDRALRSIRDAVGLDLFGIDCAIDRSGALVVFEVNASMLVHRDNADFPYKMPRVRAIKRAFEALLAAKAGKGAGNP